MCFDWKNRITEFNYKFQAENRYKVPKGTKFYRVKVRPLTKEIPESEQMTQSHASAKVIPESSTEANASHSLPSTLTKVGEREKPVSRLLSQSHKSSSCGTEDITQSVGSSTTQVVTSTQGTSSLTQSGTQTIEPLPSTSQTPPADQAASPARSVTLSITFEPVDNVNKSSGTNR